MNCEENVSQIIENLQQDKDEEKDDFVIDFLSENCNKKITSMLKNQLQPLYTAEAQLLKQNRILTSNLQSESFESLHQRQKCNTAVVNRNTLFEKCKVLEAQLEKRSKQVEKLQKEGTVLLWKREADKLVEELKRRNSILEDQIQNVKEEKEIANTRLQTRVEMLSDQLRRLKMAKQLHARPFSPVENETNRKADLERRIFLLERALIITQSELKKQQLYFAGFLQGLEKDFKIMMEKSHIKEENYNFYQISFSNMIKDILDGVVQGNVQSLRSKLASHYHGNSCKSQLLTVKKLPKCSYKKIMSHKEDLKSIEESEISEIPIDPFVTDWRDGEGPQSEANLRNMMEKGPTEIHNPTVVDKATGDVDFKLIQEKFPQLNITEIEEMHNLFTTFDVNKDDQLDTPELLKAVPESLGRMSTADEIVEAMKDTDLDHSGTIDFYEFLNILNLIKRNQGVPKLLQKESFPALGNRKSSVCSIQ